MRNLEELSRNLHILTTNGVFRVQEMQRLLNQAFDQGYSLSGGLTAIGTTLHAVVTKPF